MNEELMEFETNVVENDLGTFIIKEDGTAYFRRCKASYTTFIVPIYISTYNRKFYITKLKKSCFKLSKIRELIFPEDSHVYSIGKRLFKGASINHVFFPKSLRIIKRNSLIAYLDNEDQKLFIEIHQDNKWYASVCGTIYTKNAPITFLFSRPTIFHLCIRESTEIIGSWAFFSHTHVSFLTLPKSLRIISKDAFCSCSLLKRIVIPNSVETIGAYAFEDCMNLQKIIFDEPCKINTLPKFVFHGCSSLSEITFPSSIQKIEKSTFSYLKRIKIKNLESFEFDIVECNDIHLLCELPVSTNLKFIEGKTPASELFQIIRV